jgi:hypothetical protein
LLAHILWHRSQHPGGRRVITAIFRNHSQQEFGGGIIRLCFQNDLQIGFRFRVLLELPQICRKIAACGQIAGI